MKLACDCNKEFIRHRNNESDKNKNPIERSEEVPDDNIVFMHSKVPLLNFRMDYIYKPIYWTQYNCK